jgi:CBS domain-containing protein
VDAVEQTGDARSLYNSGRGRAAGDERRAGESDLEQQDIREMRVKDIMQTAWPTLRPDQTVEDAIKLFAESGISGTPVVDGERLVGIVTEGDLIFQDADVRAPGFLDILGGIIPLGNWEEYRREALKSAGVTVEEVMTEDPITVSPDATLSETATVMADKRVRILPVAEGERLRGVVTRMDILTLHVLNPRR